MNYVYDVGVYDYDTHCEKQFVCKTKYSSHELNVIVQECIDKFVENYSEAELYDNILPCSLDTLDIICSPLFLKFMNERGSTPLRITAKCGLADERIFDTEFSSDFFLERYSDLSLGHCDECYQEDEECRVCNKRR